MAKNSRSRRVPERRTTVWDDSFFVALRDRHRRFALYFLLEHDDVQVDELATVVTGWSGAGASKPITRDARDRVLTSLQHRHLVVLEEADLVTIDAKSNVVSRQPWTPPQRELIERALRIETSEPDP